MDCVQYTVRGVPDYLDSGLRLYAERESKSLNAVLIDMLTAGLGLLKRRSRNESLVKLAGTWVEDPAADQALAEMDRVDADMWK